MPRFAVSAFRADTGTAWRDLAQRVERLGYEMLYVPDHIGLFDPFPALVAAAAATDRLRVGTYVLNAEFWNPLLLARAAVTTDVLVDGRLVLGVGAGHAQVEFDQAGLRYPPPAERVARLERLVPALVRLCAGDTVDDEMLGLRGATTGLGGRSIPVLVGGNGNRVLRLAGSTAAVAGLTGFTSGSGQRHSNLSHWTWEGLADRLAVLHGSAGDSRPEIDVLVQRVQICDDRAQVAAEIGEATSTSASSHLDSPFLLFGSEEEIRGQLDRLDQLGVDRVTVFEPFADALASITLHDGRAT